MRESSENVIIRLIGLQNTEKVASPICVAGRVAGNSLVGAVPMLGAYLPWKEGRFPRPCPVVAKQSHTRVRDEALTVLEDA